MFCSLTVENFGCTPSAYMARCVARRPARAGRRGGCVCWCSSQGGLTSLAEEFANRYQRTKAAAVERRRECELLRVEYEKNSKVTRNHMLPRLRRLPNRAPAHCRILLNCKPTWSVWNTKTKRPPRNSRPLTIRMTKARVHVPAATPFRSGTVCAFSREGAPSDRAAAGDVTKAKTAHVRAAPIARAHSILRSASALYAVQDKGAGCAREGVPGCTVRIQERVRPARARGERGTSSGQRVWFARLLADSECLLVCFRPADWPTGLSKSTRSGYGTARKSATTRHVCIRSSAYASERVRTH